MTHLLATRNDLSRTRAKTSPHFGGDLNWQDRADAVLRDPASIGMVELLRVGYWIQLHPSNERKGRLTLLCICGELARRFRDLRGGIEEQR